LVAAAPAGLKSPRMSGIDAFAHAIDELHLLCSSSTENWIATFHCFESNTYGLTRNYVRDTMSVMENAIFLSTFNKRVHMTTDTSNNQSPTYNPDHLLDNLIKRLSLKNDAALSRALEVAPPLISKIRHRRVPVGASLLIRMHEVSDMSVRELRDLMGDRRTKFRISDAQGKPASKEKSQVNS
jgi:plasmid maintenance system antidote protein VapI